ncbi:MAG: phosphate ABC transporter permease PstA [Clostridiaceae bacterium]
MKAKTIDKVATTIFYIIAALVVALLIFLLGRVIIRGIGMLSPGFLFGGLFGTSSEGSIGLQLFNSFYLLILSLVITIPIGVGAGIYLAEYAKEGRLLKFIRLCIETMASLPSIVVGLFGLLVFVTMTRWGYTIIAGAFVIAILNLPSLTRVTENAIKDASRKVKEASLGLGATKWQTIVRVTLPSAMPQILTGVILAAGRIFGEAAALIYTAGMSAPQVKFDNFSFVEKVSPFSLFRPAETLAVHIWKLNSEGLAVNAAEIANGASAVLIIMVLLFNVLARALGNAIYNSYTGKKR